jgi:hypothetical protein
MILFLVTFLSFTTFFVGDLSSLNVSIVQDASILYLEGRGSLDSWTQPFRALFLSVKEVSFYILSQCPVDATGCRVDQIVFNGSSGINVSHDPWSSGPRFTFRSNMHDHSGSFVGGSGRLFPHVSAEVQLVLDYSTPGSLVRTLQIQALNFTPQNPTCGTTACQDLEYDFASRPRLQAVFSTWDSSVKEVALCVV